MHTYSPLNSIHEECSSTADSETSEEHTNAFNRVCVLGDAVRAWPLSSDSFTDGGSLRWE